MTLRRLRSHLHRNRTSNGDKTSDEQFYEISDYDTVSLGSLGDGRPESGFSDLSQKQRESGFSDMSEKQIFEMHMAQLQEQLVSSMIENQNLQQEIKQYKDNETSERIRQQLETERQKNRALQNQLGQARQRTGGQRRVERAVEAAALEATPAPVQLLPAESPGELKKSKFDKLWERTVEKLYDIVDDFSQVTKPADAKQEEGHPLSVKTLKENIKRFKLATKPYIDTVRGFNNLVSWKSPSFTFIVFCIYMYSAWKGWFIPLMLFLAVLRMGVSYLHSKNFKFRFLYLDSGEPEKESEDSMGLSDKFNLVLLVATKVQNGLGSAADGLEKLKNLLTWRHPAGTKRVFTLLCFSFVCMVALPTSFVWKCMGLGIGVKVFFVNSLYNKYPRLQKKYDSNYRLWQTLPTDAQYNKQYVTSQMDKYIVVARNGAEAETTVDGGNSDSDSSSDDESKSTDFRQLFSLPSSEYPLRGWMKGKRTVLVGKDKNIFTLLSKKRGKLYLTKSFLCFEREKSPSMRNIVIPLLDIVSVDKVKMNQRLPGTGMSMQILMHSNGKDNALIFGGIIGRDDVTKSIEQTIKDAKQGRQASPSHQRDSSISSRLSSENISSRIQNFTFGTLYSDSDSD